MSTIKRAVTFLLRKRYKTVILILIFTVLCVLLLISLAVKHSVGREMAALKKSLCSSFYLETNEDDPALRREVIQGEATGTVYTGPLIDQGMIDRILDNENVFAYSATDVNWLTIWTDLVFRPGQETWGLEQAKKYDLEDDPFSVMIAQVPVYMGCSDSSLHEFFRNGAFSLAAGRHIRPGDQFKAVISSYVAEHSGLTVGDTYRAEIRLA